jgi:cruciform cutting endonuclease 1
MGIKNLAYCVADVTPSTRQRSGKIDLLSWRRLDLTEDALEGTLEKNVYSDLTTPAIPKDADPFAPEFLSQTAYWLLSQNLLRYKPDVILIERQRWRSSSSSSIQQWTVRVNSLEAMLWAILTALRAESKLLLAGESKKQERMFEVLAVDPKRVGAYWLNEEVPTESPATKKKGKVAEEEDLDEDLEEEDGTSKATKKPSRAKAEKKAKISLLRSWLNTDKPSTSLSADTGVAANEVEDATRRPAIDFGFQYNKAMINSNTQIDIDAEFTRQVFLYATDTPAYRPARAKIAKAAGIEIRKEDLKKVDDLADCLLQATAYVAWAENRADLHGQFREFREEVARVLVEGLSKKEMEDW